MTPFQRWLLHVSTALVALSGLAYAFMKYLMPANDPYGSAGHPLQPYALSLHVLAGPVAIFAVGLIFREHIACRARQRGPKVNLASGLAAALLLLPMVLSGYLLQVETGEILRRWTGILHLSSGLLYAGLYALHLVGSRLRASEQTARAVEQPTRVSSQRDRNGEDALGLGEAVSALRQPGAER